MVYRNGLGGLVDVISSPMWCTASGLLLYGLAAEQAQNKKKQTRKRLPSMRTLLGSLRGVFSDLL